MKSCGCVRAKGSQIELWSLRPDSVSVPKSQSKLGTRNLINMNTESNCLVCHRRGFLRSALAGSAAFFAVPGAFAEALTLTPKDAEGPFYPDNLPLDTDNDLLILNDAITPAVGEVTHLSGVGAFLNQ